MPFPFSYNEKSVLLLVFFLVGVILTGLSGWKWLRLRNASDKWLAGFIGLCVLYISPFMLGYAGWYSLALYRNILFYLPLQQLLLIGPVLYIYTRSLLNPSFRVSRKEALHFVPALLYNLAMFVVFLNDRVVQSDYFFYADGRDMDLDPWYQWAGWISMVVYLVLSIRYYNRYRRAVFDTYSFAEALLYRWMQQFLIAFLGILILRALFFVLNPEWGEFGSKFWYYLSFSALFNYIGFRGFIHSVQVEAGTKAFDFEREKARIPPLIEQEASAEETKTVDIKNLPELLEKLEDYMQDRSAYKNPKLTLSDVAAELETNPKVISTIVNTQFGMNFNDWVNTYRVESVKRMFARDLHKEQTILSIALEAGFNSKSTFNRAFKKHTGATPVRYLDNHLQQ